MTRRLRAAPVAVAFLLSTLLASSTALAEPRQERTIRERTVAVFLSTFPQAWAAIQSIWEKEGSSLDPFGNPKPSSMPPPASASGTGIPSGQ
jgi:hypothetical protein